MTSTPGPSLAQRTAARLGAKSEIQDVRLLNAALALESFAAVESGLRYELNVAPSVERSDSTDDGFILRCKYDIGIQTVPADPESEPISVANISCEFGALYNLEPLGDHGPTDDEFEAFSQTIGQLSLWPYAREFMQSATSRLGIPTLTLGMFRVGMSQQEAEVSGE